MTPRTLVRDRWVAPRTLARGSWDGTKVLGARSMAWNGPVRDQRTARPTGRRGLCRESQAGRMARARRLRAQTNKQASAREVVGVAPRHLARGSWVSTKSPREFLCSASACALAISSLMRPKGRVAAGGHKGLAALRAVLRDQASKKAPSVKAPGHWLGMARSATSGPQGRPPARSDAPERRVSEEARRADAPRPQGPNKNTPTLRYTSPYSPSLDMREPAARVLCRSGVSGARGIGALGEFAARIIGTARVECWALGHGRSPLISVQGNRTSYRIIGV